MHFQSNSNTFQLVSAKIIWENYSVKGLNKYQGTWHMPRITHAVLLPLDSDGEKTLVQQTSRNKQTTSYINENELDLE